MLTFQGLTAIRNRQQESAADRVPLQPTAAGSPGLMSLPLTATFSTRTEI